jgi:hypothetical protein
MVAAWADDVVCRRRSVVATVAVKVAVSQRTPSHPAWLWGVSLLEVQPRARQTPPPENSLSGIRPRLQDWARADRHSRL